MPLNQKLADIDKILDTEYEKLAKFRLRIASTASLPEQFDLEQRIKEINQNIRKYKAEYWQLLAQEAHLAPITEADANNAILQVVQNLQIIASKFSASYPDELRQKLQKILNQLQEVDNPATAKAKLTLNLIPEILFYEVDLATETSLLIAFQPLRQLFETSLIQTPVISPDATCPYRGLLAFQEQDQEYFFGRNRYVEDLLKVVRQQPLVALIGASGSGKSSVVFAGLIPQLRATGNWLIESFRPQNQASYALAAALVRLLKPELDEIQQLGRAKELLADMEKGLTLPEILAIILQRHPDKRILLVIDQFEELYTLCQDTQEQQRFVDAILAAIESAPNKLTVVLTLRADFFSYVLNYAHLGEALQQYKPQLLSAMNREEMETAIEQPAQKMGVTLEEGLTERILDDVKQEPGNLPLLEFALTQLWAKQNRGQLTHQAYEEIGGVAKALANHAEAVFEELNEADKKRTERVLIQLVRPGEATEDTRCITTREAVNGENWDLVTRLASSRLVVTGRDEKKQTETVEVVHEALIREWTRLQGWMNDNREFRTWQERLKGRMQEWEATGKDEGALLRGLALAEAEDWRDKRKDELSTIEKEFIQEGLTLREREKKQQKRRQRLTTIGLSSFTIIATSLSGVAGLGWRNAAINQINSLAKTSDALLNSNQPEALKTSLKASVQMQHTPWVDSDTRRQVELTLLHTVHNVAAPNVLGGHGSWVTSVSFSPDGKMLASASHDKTVKLWDTSTGQELKILKGHTGFVTDISFSPDGKMLASTSNDKTVKLWDTTTGKELKTLRGHTNFVFRVSFSPDGKMLASTSYDAMIKLWDTSTGAEITTLTGHNNSVYGVSFSPDSKMLASASSDGTVKLWDATTGKELKTFLGHKNVVYDVSFSPDSKMLVSASGDWTVKLWDITTGKELKTLRGHTQLVNSVSFSSDGKMLVSASGDRTVKLWDTSTGKELKIFLGHTQSVSSASLSPDSNMLASASGDGTVKLWDTNTGKELKTLQAHKNIVFGVSFSPDSKMLASASGDGTVKLWDTNTGREFKTLQGHTQSVNSVSFSPDGKMLASGSGDRTVKLWDTTTGKELKTIQAHNNTVYGVSFSPDGKMLASASGDRTVKLWDTSTGKLIKILSGHTNGVWGVSFSPDGKMLASASADKTVKLWDTTTGKELKTLNGRTNEVYGVSFSSDGKMLAFGTRDNMVQLWDTTTGKEIKTLSGHTNGVWGVSFSPDGKLLASTSFDYTIKLWDTNTGKELKTLMGHQNAVYAVSFSRDSKMLASVSADYTVRLWRWNFDYLLNEGCNFIRGYFKTNPSNDQSDKHLCDGISER